MSPQERHRYLCEWNATDQPFPEQACIHTFFEAQAQHHGSNIALVFENITLSYSELNARANRLAHKLVSVGVKPDDPVAVCMDRSIEMVVGLLGVAKAGGAYVPLEPDYPSERLNYILKDSAPTVVVTHGAARKRLNSALAGLADVAVIELQAEGDQWLEFSAANLPPESIGLRSRHLAYLIYTSGSTGRPKGVMVEHRSVVNRLLWMQAKFRIGPDDAILQKTPFSFDVSVWELFWPLMSGSRLVICRPGGHKDPFYLADIIRSRAITVIHFVPSMFQAFLAVTSDQALPSLSLIFCSGEELPKALAKQICKTYPQGVLFNLYGPTEATVDVTFWACHLDGMDDGALIPIGRPIANTRIYILDEVKEPVPPGIAGELYIGGVGVARGYRNRRDLTAERFILSPFVDGDILYKTGDLARFRPDGNIEFLGRSDFQVKLRGFRIELNEIEFALTSHPLVREAVVKTWDDEHGTKRLVAYCTGFAKSSDDLTKEILIQHLSVYLPDYMVPAIYIFLEKMPLTENGKLDRNSLPVPREDSFLLHSREEPADDIERIIAKIWSQELHASVVGRHDNFFSMGGDSLIAMQIIYRTYEAFGVNVGMTDLFESATLLQFSERVRKAM